MNVLLVHTLAHACKCTPMPPREGFPLDGEVGVPLDAAVLLRLESWEEAEPSDFLLRDLGAGEEVLTTRTEVDGGDGYALVLTPRTQLAPETAHAVREGWGLERGFTTGTELAAPIEVAPSLDVEDVVSQGWTIMACAPENYVELSITGDAAWWEIEVTVNGGDALSWPVADSTPIVGDTGCFLSYPLEPGDDLVLRARGVNAAGAPGPWSEAVEAHLCACDGAGVGPGLAWLTGALVVVRRRRR